MALERAWKFRTGSQPWEPLEHRALRLWFGPGEARGREEAALKHWAIDGYGPYLWITEWGDGESQAVGQSQTPGMDWIHKVTEEHYRPEGYLGAVVLRRPRQGVPELPQLLWGAAPPEKFEVREGNRKFWIKLMGSCHPGLFLDHRPLRDWLEQSGECRGRKVLNAFAYTGSLSVAAGLGGASQVTTQDLSKATLAWARENTELNGMSADLTRFLAGDFFEEVPRLKRKGETFGVVISDPPSFSRGKKGNFSTQRDLVHLHEVLLSVTEPGGVVVSSINSANVSVQKFESDFKQAAAQLGIRISILDRIEQPASFPWQASEPKSRYLKGLVVRR